MARRPTAAGSALWRRAVVADMRRTQRAFPTSDGRARLDAVETGGPVEVSSGRLFRGLHLLGHRETADLFRATGRGERWFVLDADDRLTEQSPGQVTP